MAKRRSRNLEGISGRKTMIEVEIHIEEKIDTSWSEWFAGMKITHSEDDTSVVIGKLKDQPALYGLIGKMRDLGLHLKSIKTQDKEDANNVM